MQYSLAKSARALHQGSLAFVTCVRYIRSCIYGVFDREFDLRMGTSLSRLGVQNAMLGLVGSGDCQDHVRREIWVVHGTIATGTREPVVSRTLTVGD